jgi:hypothetical protein
VPYELVPLLLSVGLTVRYLLGDEASRGAKAAMVVVVGVSLLLWWQFPQWTAAATVLQVVACIALLLHLRLSA